MELKEQERAEQIIQETPPEERYEDRFDDAEETGFGLADDGFGAKPVTGAHVTIRDMADQKRRNKRLMGISMIWFVTIFALAMAALWAFQNRQAIVEKYPGTATIYKAMGINVNAIGLEFEDPIVRQMMINGDNTLLIEGHIVNITDQTRDIPMLELSIVNASDEEVATWVIEPPQPTLEAAGRIKYTSEYPNPPVDMDEIEYRFLDADEMIDPVDTPLEPLDNVEGMTLDGGPE